MAEAKDSNGGKIPPPTSVVPGVMTRISSSLQIMSGLRFFAFLTTFIGGIVMGVANEVIGGGYASSGTVFKAVDMSQCAYFVAVNVIVASYSIASLLILVCNKDAPNKKMILLVVAIVDFVVVAFLFSAVGSAVAMSVFFTEGSMSSDAGYGRTYNDLSSGMVGGIVISMFGTIDYSIIVLLSIVVPNHRPLMDREEENDMCIAKV